MTVEDAYKKAVELVRESAQTLPGYCLGSHTVMDLTDRLLAHDSSRAKEPSPPTGGETWFTPSQSDFNTTS